MRCARLRMRIRTEEGTHALEPLFAPEVLLFGASFSGFIFRGKKLPLGEREEEVSM